MKFNSFYLRTGMEEEIFKPEQARSYQQYLLVDLGDMKVKSKKK